MNQYFSGTNNVGFNSKVSLLTACPTIAGVRNASEKILLVEEDPLTINDGHFQPPLYDTTGAYISGTGSLDLLCIRHDRKPSQPDTAVDRKVQCPNPDMRGNVSFVDGHAEYVTRSYAHSDLRFYPQKGY